MSHRLHSNAKTTPKTRAEISQSTFRATRWVFLDTYSDQTEQRSVDFLARLKAACPVHIQTILTDNGSQFTDQELEQTLKDYLKTYNHHIPQRSLGHLCPINALKLWQQKQPELFVTKVYTHAGLDTLQHTP